MNATDNGINEQEGGISINYGDHNILIPDEGISFSDVTLTDVTGATEKRYQKKEPEEGCFLEISNEENQEEEIEKKEITNGVLNIWTGKIYCTDEKFYIDLEGELYENNDNEEENDVCFETNGKVSFVFNPENKAWENTMDNGITTYIYSSSLDITELFSDTKQISSISRIMQPVKNTLKNISLIGIGVVGANLYNSMTPDKSSSNTPAIVNSTKKVTASVNNIVKTSTYEYTIEKGSNIFQTLIKNGISKEEVMGIIKILEKKHDLNSVTPGAIITIKKANSGTVISAELR